MKREHRLKKSKLMTVTDYLTRNKAKGASVLLRAGVLFATVIL